MNFIFISALATMTVLSALLGFVVTTFVPTIYTYYTCTAIMFIFGLKMLWDGLRMKSNEAEEIQNEVAMEITNRYNSSRGKYVFLFIRELWRRNSFGI